MTNITVGIHETPLWPCATPVLDDGDIYTMMLDGATFQAQDNADAWLSVESDLFIRDIARNA